jgi:hypothetical protein
MLSKVLAVLLVFFWIAVSGFNLGERADFSTKVSAHHGGVNFNPSMEDADDLLKSGDLKGTYRITIFIPVNAASKVDQLRGDKVAQIHKLHSVFLI